MQQRPHGATLARAATGAAFGDIRATGALAQDARFTVTTGSPPHMLLQLEFLPPTGLRYIADVDLGPDPAHHRSAKTLQPALRSGCLVSVAAQGLQLRTDHSHAALRLVQPHSVIVLADPADPAEPAAITATTNTPQLQELPCTLP